MNILVTGCAGFIGFHLTKSLLENGHKVTGLDNINDYYEVLLKKHRLQKLDKKNFNFHEVDLNDFKTIEEIFKSSEIDIVVNMAAQAGVRYSISNPKAYIDSNITGFTNLIELSKNHEVSHFVYASSSSVYGKNTKIPFSTSDHVDHPVSLYAATKKSNEVIAHAYSHLFNIPTTGLRFFTVYGPFGRPDMAYFSFTKKIFSNEEIEIYNNGEMSRDFTYIDDLRDALGKIIFKPPKPSESWDSSSPSPNESNAPFKIFNIGNNNPVRIMDFVETIEEITGRKFRKKFIGMQLGDVKNTYADINDIKNEFGFDPKTTIYDGMKEFINWYKEYYKV